MPMVGDAEALSGKGRNLLAQLFFTHARADEIAFDLLEEADRLVLCI